MIMSTLVNTNGRLADGSKLTPRLWAILAVVVLADVLDLMDSTITNIAAPTIVQEIGGGESLIKWLRASYALAIGVSWSSADASRPLWQAADLVRGRYLSTRLHQNLAPDADFRFVTVALWESEQAFREATSLRGARSHAPQLRHDHVPCRCGCST
jgi:hypothetical protein